MNRSLVKASHVVYTVIGLLLVLGCASNESLGSEEADAVFASEAFAEQIDENTLYPAQLLALVDQQLTQEVSGAGPEATLHDRSAVCMNDRGFDFPPPPSSTATSQPTVPEQGLTETEFAQRYGFGVAFFGSQTAKVRDSSNYVQSYANSLDSGERGAFLEAYIGIPVTDPDSAITLDADSCLAVAQGQMAIDRNSDPALAFADLLASAVADIEDRFETNGEVRGLYDVYSQCMREKGYPVSHPDEAVGLAQPPLLDFFATHGVKDEFDGYDSQAQEALDEIVSAETIVALDSLDCQAPVRADLARIYARVEDQWIQDNQPSIAAMTGR